ncbi:MAG: hypothetical protein MJZ45_00965 [Bacteroidales bacterium]|nr:hypothetical protein [Bacteroidales bacterium]
MKGNKKKYVSPCVEAMNCKVEKGFQCSGCDGGMLQNLTEGDSADNLFN